jgi:DNA invertase Pin-like site-specific DNA recombinase
VTNSSALLESQRTTTTSVQLPLDESQKSSYKQIDALKEAGCEQWFVDKITGTKVERKGLDEALTYLRPEDTFVVWKLDGAARSLTPLSPTL